MESKVCSSCKKKVVNDNGTVNFNCPQCGNYKIIRCSGCRTNAVRYSCPACEFTGPN